MKLYVCHQANEIIWPDYLDDFLEESTPVKFIEHIDGLGLGTYPYVPTDDESSDLRDYGGKIYVLADVDEYDDGLVMIDGEVYEERDGMVFEVDEAH